MRPIFISYRRDDTEGQAGRLFQDLRDAFGEQAVFMDVATIEPGVDFRRAIEKHTASCGALLALIGRHWLSATGADGKRRLDDPHDFVRLETAAALQRDIPVIPVLLQDARMVRAEELPDDLKELAFRNSVELTHARWDSDVQVLIKALRPLVEAPPQGLELPPPLPAPPPLRAPSVAASAGATRSKRGLAVAAVAVAVMAGGGAWYVEHQRAAELAAQAAAAQAAAAKAIEDKAAAEKAAADKAAADKAAADKAAADRVVAAERAAAQRAAAAQKAEAERLALERRKTAAAEAERLERERRQAEEQERQRAAQREAEAQRLEAERRQADAERVTAAKREAQIRAARNGECLSGYVWREAWAGDKVCVTPDIRNRTAAENAGAANTRQPGGGSYGPNTCRQGYVWREARAGDVVCVGPASRDQARADNAAAAARRVQMPR